jgi:protein-tyrosine phosphatase
MDNSNYNNVMNVPHSPEEETKVEKLLDYGTADINEVPDPYYEGGFDYVYDIINEAIDDFIEKHL